LTITAGIVTYHAAYNFGSVLQALATQKAVEKLGVNASIIDYRPISQARYYKNMYRLHSGMKSLIVDMLNTPNNKAKRIRAQRFERFIHEQLNLTDTTYTKPHELDSLGDKYDVYISGSDQILNKHSNELENENWSFMNPYLLTFAAGRKISYASSPASMSEQEILEIKSELMAFDMMSARELDSAECLTRLTGRTVPNVLDPTLLFSGEEWLNIIPQGQTNLPDAYVLYYTLLGPKQVQAQKAELKKISMRMNMPVLTICPYAYIPDSDTFLNGLSAGPAEFVYALKHAALVVTDSYHGTLFSMNFQTPFWSVSNGKGSHTRKNQILEKMGMQSRIVSNIAEINHKESPLPSVQSPHYKTLISRARDESFGYLKSAIALGNISHASIEE
jgi:hypothetical protein